MNGINKLPIPLLMKHRPDFETEQKRDYNPPIPFQLEENIGDTPAEVVIDYAYLFLFLMSMGSCIFIYFYL